MTFEQVSQKVLTWTYTPQKKTTHTQSQYRPFLTCYQIFNKV